MSKVGKELINGIEEAIDHERGEKKLIVWDGQLMRRGRIYSAEDWNMLQTFFGILKKLSLYEEDY